MNNVNLIPICHGYSLMQLQAIIGNQVILINRLSEDLETAKIEIEELKKKLEISNG